MDLIYTRTQKSPQYLIDAKSFRTNHLQISLGNILSHALNIQEIRHPESFYLFHFEIPWGKEIQPAHICFILGMSLGKEHLFWQNLSECQFGKEHPFCQYLFECPWGKENQPVRIYQQITVVINITPFDGKLNVAAK